MSEPGDVDGVQGGADDDADDDFDDDYDHDDPNQVAGPTAVAVLEHLVTSLVDDPDGVEIEADESRGAATLRVRVSPGDMGRVIGKRGRTAGAIRTVVRAAGTRDGIDVDVDFVD